MNNVAYPRTVAAPDMRSINRSAILEIIRREGPISRNAIAQRLDVSLPTVMRIVDELVAEEVVRPTGSSQWTGGRRRALLEFNAEAQLVLGVDLGGSRLYGALADLGGNVVDEADVPNDGATDEASFCRVVELIERLMASPKVQGRRIRGIGVGAPGITMHKEGIVRWAYTLKWKDFPLKARLAERFQAPISVDNDVNMAVLGELWFGSEQNTQNMLLVAIGTGIGAGIIIDGVLYRGAHEASGEIGSMVPGPEFLGHRYVDFGALESIASGTGIKRRAQQALKGHRKRSELEALTTEEVFELARQGKAWARNIIEETVDYLATAVANVCVSFDPEVIILGGGVARSADLLVAPILKRIDSAIPTPPRLVVSTLGRRATVMGAITNVLHSTDSFYQVRRLT